MVMFFVFLSFLHQCRIWNCDLLTLAYIHKIIYSSWVVAVWSWNFCSGIIWYVLLMGSLCAVWGTQHHIMCFVDDITVSSMRYSTSYNTFCYWRHCVCSVRYSTSYDIFCGWQHCVSGITVCSVRYSASYNMFCWWGHWVQCEVLSIIWYVLLMGSLSAVWGTQHHMICFVDGVTVPCEVLNIRWYVFLMGSLSAVWGTQHQMIHFVDGVTECRVRYSASDDTFCWWGHWVQCEVLNIRWYVLLMGSLSAVWGTQHQMIRFVDGVTVHAVWGNQHQMIRFVDGVTECSVR